MIRKIIDGYGSMFASIGKVLFLLLLCVILGSAVVLPLWKFAVTSPHAYSISILILAAGLILYFLAKKIRTKGIKTYFSLALKTVTVCAGIFFCVFFVMAEKRILSLLALLATTIIYGIVSFGISPSKNTELKSETDEIN